MYSEEKIPRAYVIPNSLYYYQQDSHNKKYDKTSAIATYPPIPLAYYNYYIY